MATSHSFNPEQDIFSMVSVDPVFLQYPPAEPYSILTPGTPIERGDQRRTLGDGNEWTWAEDWEIGREAPPRDVAYARVCWPSGYVSVEHDDEIQGNELYWKDSSWLNIEQNGVIKPGHKVRINNKPKSGIGFDCLVCKPVNPDVEVPDHRMANLPPMSREMYEFDEIRRGDLYLSAGMTEWKPVGGLLHGTQLPVPTEKNGFLRYARPIGADYMVWYINEDTEIDGGMGGVDDPFKSIETAGRVLKDAAELAKKRPHGVLWDQKRNLPVAVFDLPEPEDIASMRDKVLKQSRLLGKHNETNVSQKKADNPTTGQKRRVVKTTPANREAKKRMPNNYRLMYKDEEFRQGDLVWLSLEDDDDTHTWMPVAPELMESTPGVLELIGARKQIKTDTGDKAVAAIDKLGKIEKMLEDIKASLFSEDLVE